VFVNAFIENNIVIGIEISINNSYSIDLWK